MAEENRRPKRTYADVSMQNDLLKEAPGKNDAASSTPRAGRESGGDKGCQLLRSTIVLEPMAEMVSPCRAFGISETRYRYSPKQYEESERIADLLVGLTNAQKLRMAA